jgi:hypothetical protein
MGDDRSLSEAARQKDSNEGVVVGAGTFGPSRKKEAAARRVGNYELWGLNAAMIRDSWLRARCAGDFVVDCRSDHGCRVTRRHTESV